MKIAIKTSKVPDNRFTCVFTNKALIKPEKKITTENITKTKNSEKKDEEVKV
jgi:hypothetical protein